jgi:perosamine synthetase
MEYQRFDPTNCGFPRSRVPILPALRRQSFGRSRPGPFKPLGTDTATRFFARGRYALTEAYRQSGVGESGALLAPAYHCRTMLDPAIRLGAKIGLYALKPDLSPDIDALAASLDACQQPVKALLVTHYFGFAQTLEPIANFCTQHNIALIEDCSHALFVDSEISSIAKSGAMGRTGRFCVASPYKFFPSEDGGILWANDSGILPNESQPAPTLAQEVKGLIHSAQRASDQNQAQNIDLPDTKVSSLMDKLTLTGSDLRLSDAQVSTYYVATTERKKSLAWSRWVIRHSDIDRLANLRRQNYLTWAAAVADLPYCRALFPSLAPECVPYMFPLQIDHPEIHFFALKHLGVPIWRWDDMAVSNCPVASSYRLKILHLPCHQELTTKQMSWMTTAVAKVMTQLPTGNNQWPVGKFIG